MDEYIKLVESKKKYKIYYKISKYLISPMTYKLKFPDDTDEETFHKALVHAIQDNPKFPKCGYLRKAKGYYYLEIKDDGTYIFLISNILKIFYGKDLPVDECKPGKYMIMPPHSVVGTHASISEKDYEKYQPRRKIYFEITDLTTYYHDKKGYCHRGDLSAMCPCKWFVLNIRLEDFQRARHHISVSIISRRRK